MSTLSITRRALAALCGVALVAPAPLASATTTAPGGALVTSSAASVHVVAPPVHARVDYQLGGGYRPPAGVGVVTRDVTEKPAPGTYGICYVNAFQTQPGTAHWWLTRHPSLVLRTAAGVPVRDPGWPDELLLSTATSSRRSALATVLGGQLARCAREGYRAVELDNLDSWTRSGRRLTMSENASYARLLVVRAHRLGLAVAQKNDVDMLTVHRAIGFDFAVVEECQVFAECMSFTRAYGAHVIEIEYSDGGGTTNFRAACRARGAAISIVYRDRHLLRPGQPGYVYSHC